ncbi:MAG: YXWGXW repeat-containing protein [Gammaproteobacteria bacterium]|nr:YXWGXW repeat-containing protein [Gammaproteobacteria bacterium]
MKRILVAFLMMTALAAPLMAVPGTASAQVYLNVSVGFAPPPIPWYPQPLCPGIGYMWTPGYWDYGPYGYYWVPGTWVLAPAVGLFWTPGYWAWDGGQYWWHAGYWGPTVGFYGGIDYGYGYNGRGYWGGYWRGNSFYYNRAITNVNVTYIHNTYSQPVSNTITTGVRVSYNGGIGGIPVRPTPEQRTYAEQRHVSPTAMQLQQQRVALRSPDQRFAVNQGRPQIVANGRAGVFTGTDVVRMNSGRTGYEYRGEAHPLPPAVRNEVRVEREPQVRPAQPNVNQYRPEVRPMPNNYAPPVRVENPRPTPPPVREENPQYSPRPMPNREVRRVNTEPHVKEPPRNSRPKDHPCCGMPR